MAQEIQFLNKTGNPNETQEIRFPPRLSQGRLAERACAGCGLRCPGTVGHAKPASHRDTAAERDPGSHVAAGTDGDG
jgi:hypothetical protein